jgi:hypothetical protein
MEKILWINERGENVLLEDAPGKKCRDYYAKVPCIRCGGVGSFPNWGICYLCKGAKTRLKRFRAYRPDEYPKFLKRKQQREERERVKAEKSRDEHRKIVDATGVIEAIAAGGKTFSVRVKALLLKTSPRAIFVNVGGSKVWIPLSLITAREETADGYILIRFSGWFAEKSGIDLTVKKL